MTPLPRTVGQNRIVDELVVSLIHDREMRVYLPGWVLPQVVVTGFAEAGRVAYEHIYWDQATLLVKVGLLDQPVDISVPIYDVMQAQPLALEHDEARVLAVANFCPIEAFVFVPTGDDVLLVGSAGGGHRVLEPEITEDDVIRSF